MHHSYIAKEGATDHYGAPIPKGKILTALYDRKYGSEKKDTIFSSRDYRAEIEYRATGSWIESHPEMFEKFNFSKETT